MWELMLAAVCVFICLCVCVFMWVFFFLFLHSLECLGLRGDHHRCGAHPRQVSWVELCRAEFGATAGLRRFGDYMVVRRWYWREVFRLPAFFKGSHHGQSRPGPTGGAVVHHRLSGGGPGARTTGARGGERVWLHQFGFGSFRIFPKT